MDLEQKLAQIVWELMSHGSVSYETLRHTFGLSDDDLETVRHELITVKKCAVDRDGLALDWALGGQSAPVAQPDKAKPARRGTERRPLTIMFCDLVGSTDLSTRLDAEDFQEVIGQYRDGVTAIVERHAGYVAKYMGDGVLVYFGYPKALERSVEQAISCAHEMIGFVAGLRPSVDAAGDVELAVRIGVETGLVVVGELIGKGPSQERSILGQAPNLAARLQEIASQGQLVIGPNAHRAAHKTFLCHPLGEQSLKGFSRPVAAWAVEPALDGAIAGGEQGAAEPGCPVVFGRDAEVATLSNLWAGISDGAGGSSVVLRGEAGIGKTRMVDVITARALRDEARVMTFQFTPYHSNSALYPVVRLLRRRAGIGPQDTQAQTKDKLGRLFQTGLAEHATELALLAILLGSAEDAKTLNLAAGEHKRQTLQAIVALVVHLARKAQMLVVWEDVHWADPTSLEVIQHLDAAIASAPVLMVLTTRPIGPAETDLSTARVIDLGALQSDDARHLIAHVSGKTLPVEVVEHILSRAEDIPLFIEETTKSVLESALVQEGEDGYVLAKPITAMAPTVPETLQDSVIARLQSAPMLLEIAQAGAAFGREFTLEMIAAVTDLRPEDMRAGLERLCEGGLVTPQKDGTGRLFVFKHALIQDAAYDSLLRRNRRALHRRAAEFLQSDGPSSAQDNPETIARHYAAAQDYENAVTHFVAAGDKAARTSANQEAVAHLGNALSMLLRVPLSPERDAMELSIQNRLINPMIATHGHAAPETDATSRRAVELCRSLGNTQDIFPGLYGLWLVDYASARIASAKRHAVDYLDVAETISGRVPRLVGHRLNGVSDLFLGNPKAGRDHLMTALDLYVPAEDSISALSYSQDFGVSIFGDLGLSNALLGDVAKAREWADMTLARARDIQHANNLAFGLHVLTILGYTLADWDMMRTLTEELEEISSRHNLRAFQAGGRVVQASLMSREGRAKKGLARLEEAIAVLEEVSFTVYGPITTACKSDVLAGLGRIEEAEDEISTGLLLTGKTHEHWFDAELYRMRGLLKDKQGRHDEARADFNMARDVAQAQNARIFALRIAENGGCALTPD